MRVGVLLSVALIPLYAHGATVVKFGATLCGPGGQFMGGACTNIVRGKCPAGYYTTTIGPSTYTSITLKQQCMNSYTKTFMPVEFYPIYDGVLINFGATLCGPDKQLVAGECVPKEQRICPDGFYKTTAEKATFAAPSADLSECTNSYNRYDYPEYIDLVYNGLLVNFGATLCGAGKYLSDGTCVSRTRGECPSDFYQIHAHDETLTPSDMGACGNGYDIYGMHADCNAGQSVNGLCAVLCESGLRYTGVGTCAPVCADGAGTMHTSAGASFPVYATPQVTPSLTIKTPGGDMCYINALPGRVAGTINIKTSDNKTYHITD